MKLKFGDVLLKYLEAEGVEYVFGVPGTTVVPFLSAFNRSQTIRPILAKHEEGAAFMADGYARVKNTIGACFSTSGPGATNLVTGVANAFMDNVPMLVITGQVDTVMQGKGAFQDSSKEGIDSVKMFEPITKSSSMIINSHKAIEDLQSALRRALTGKKGPVHLTIPKDIQGAEVEFNEVAPASYRFRPEYFDRRLVINAVEELVNAKCPAILIGSGAVASGACAEISELAEMLSIPVATTPKAKGAFPENHPLALGVLGLCGSPLAEAFLKSDEIDVLLIIGAGLNQMTTMSWDPHLAPSKCLIHVNIDPTEIGKSYTTHIPLVGDARTIISEMNFRFLRYAGELEDTWKEREKILLRFRSHTGMYTDPEKLHSDAMPLKPQRLINDLQESLPDDAVLFVDVGNSITWATHYMQIKRPGSLITPFGMLSMGYGIAASIGGKLAAGNRPVVCVAGDGCFLMNGMEIATAVSNEIPMVFVIVRNNKLGLVNDLQTFVLGKNTVATRFKPIDAAKVAEGLGAEAYKADKPGELKTILPQAISSGKVVVIDCFVDPEEIPPLVPFVEGMKNFAQRIDFA